MTEDEPLNTATRITCGSCRGSHTSVAEVKACYGARRPGGAGAALKAAAAEQPATDKQAAFLRRLLAERECGVTDVERFITDSTLLASRKLTSQTINNLLTLSVKQAATGQKRGDVHVVDGTYFRIHVGQQSGKPYACKARILSEAVWGEKDGKRILVKAGQVKWDYEPSMTRSLVEANRATAEESKAFGEMVGRCCFCSTKIDTPESVAAGYGPTCAGNYGLPWGSAVQG